MPKGPSPRPDETAAGAWSASAVRRAASLPDVVGSGGSSGRPQCLQCPPSASGTAVPGRCGYGPGGVNLRRWNLVVGMAHLGQATLMLALSNDLSLPVTASWATGDPVVARMPAAPEEVFSLAIGPAVALFLLLAAADHLVLAAPRVHPWYERLLDERRNHVRWIEYSVSAALMMVLVARFTGVADLAALIGIFALTTSMILFGLLMERQQRPGAADWRAFWFGSLAGVVPWVIVAVYLVNGASPPGFVYAIMAFQFVFFASFALNMALQYRQVGRWRDYRFGEAVYLLLSLGAKSVLAWLVFANVLRT